MKGATQIDLVDSIIKTRFNEDLRKRLMEARMGRLVEVAMTKNFKLMVQIGLPLVVALRFPVAQVVQIILRIIHSSSSHTLSTHLRICSRTPCRTCISYDRILVSFQPWPCRTDTFSNSMTLLAPQAICLPLAPYYSSCIPRMTDSNEIRPDILGNNLLCSSDI